jgi:hypothetical protein
MRRAPESEAHATDNVALLRSIWDPIERGESDRAWVSEAHEGRITRIVEIQHLGAVAEAVRDVSRAQSGAAAQHGSASTT